jgi:fructokinase
MRFGIDIGGTKVAGAVIGDDGAELAAARQPIPRGDYAGTLATVAAVIDALAAAVDRRPDRIGVGLPGNVDAGRGEVRLGNTGWLAGHPLRDDLARVTRAQVRLANDADCFALSEAVDGAGRGARSVFGLILGTGVGGGFVYDGRHVTGCLGIAGEIGHIPMPRGTADELAAGPCSCGRSGCVETLLSGPSLSADFARATGTPRAGAPDPRALAERAAAGDADAEAAFDRYEERLGRVIGLLCTLLEPDVIVLGGGVSNVARIATGAARRALPHVFGDRMETKVLRNVHGDASGVRGAARLWE